LGGTGGAVAILSAPSSSDVVVVVIAIVSVVAAAVDPVTVLIDSCVTPRISTNSVSKIKVL